MLICPAVSPRPSVASGPLPKAVPWASFAGGLGAVLLPKCPMCLAAYGTAFGALGLSPAAHHWLVESMIAIAVVVSFGLVLTLAIRRRDGLTPLVSALGAVLVLAGRFAFDVPAMTAVGTLLLVVAAVTNSARCRG